jgi:hypothetical protein
MLLFSSQLSPHASLPRSKHSIVLVHPKYLEQSYILHVSTISTYMCKNHVILSIFMHIASYGLQTLGTIACVYIDSRRSDVRIVIFPTKHAYTQNNDHEIYACFKILESGAKHLNREPAIGFSVPTNKQIKNTPSRKWKFGSQPRIPLADACV